MLSATGSIRLTAEERSTLEAQARSHRGRADAVRRARVIVLLADGASYRELGHVVDCTAMTIAKWKARFLEARVEGLRGRHRGSKPRVLTPQLEARILSWTRRARPHGSTRWSTRILARKLGIQHTVVARAWLGAGLQPYRLTKPKVRTQARRPCGA
jgi:transposase